jgi:hypothetical protein
MSQRDGILSEAAAAFLASLCGFHLSESNPRIGGSGASQRLKPALCSGLGAETEQAAEKLVPAARGATTRAEARSILNGLRGPFDCAQGRL